MSTNDRNVMWGKVNIGSLFRIICSCWRSFFFILRMDYYHHVCDILHDDAIVVALLQNYKTICFL